MPILAPQTNVEVRVFGIGTVEAQVVSKVGFQVAGKIRAISADQGDFVKAGALLAKLDDDAQRAKLMKSEAVVRQAAANLLKAQAQRDRAEVSYQQKKNVNARRQTLVGRGAVSQEAADDAQAAEEIARSDLRLVEADVAVAKVLQDDAAAQRRIDAVLLDQHELRAPFDARVIARHKELGSVANAGEAVFTLIEPDSIWMRAYHRRGVGRRTANSGRRRSCGFARRPPRLRDRGRSHRPGKRSRHGRAPRLCALPQMQSAASDPLSRRTGGGRNRQGDDPGRMFVPLRFVEGYDGRSGTIWVIENGRLAKRRLQFGDRLLDGRVQIAVRASAGRGDRARQLIPGCARDARRARHAAEQVT